MGVKRRSVLIVVAVAMATTILAISMYEYRSSTRWRSFIVYYGGDAIEELKGFDLIVLPPTVRPAAVEELKASGATVVAYLSIATLGGWEPWANKTPSNITIAWRPAWRERVVNPCTLEWRKVFSWALNYIARMGFNGVLLDNLDLVEEYPWMEECMVSLVCSVKENHPDMIVIVNRGFRLLGRIAGCIDGILYENPLQATGMPADKGIVEARIHMRIVYEEARRHGIQLLVLVYVDLDNKDMVENIAETVCRILPDKHIPVYLAEPTLTRIGYVVDCSKLSR